MLLAGVQAPRPQRQVAACVGPFVASPADTHADRDQAGEAALVEVIDDDAG